MATTANHPDGGSSFVGGVPGSGSAGAEPDEDIAAIRKQISDHAEVIYQTWKARGLAPNEILTCHNSLNAADKFGSVLAPGGYPPPTSTSSSAVSGIGIGGIGTPPSLPSGIKTTKSATPVMDFLYSNSSNAAAAAAAAAAASMNASNLEQIVNKFVVEDKARLAARQKSDAPGVPSTARNYPSSIQYALQKFERRSPDVVVNSPVKFASPRVDKSIPSSSLSLSPSSSSSSSSKLTSNNTNNNNSFAVKPTPIVLSSPSSPTSNTSFPERLIPTNNAPQMTKPGADHDDVDNSVYVGSSSTWPLKAKSVFEQSSNIGEKSSSADRTGIAYKYSTLPSKVDKYRASSAADQFLDEVAKEEERLINALKTGMVITAANDPKIIPVTMKIQKTESLSSKEKFNSTPKLKTPCVPSTLSSDVKEIKKNDFHNDALLAKRTPRRVPGSSSSEDQQRINGKIPSTNPTIATNGFSNQQTNPVRPFLTRGSVAERVMMFEKCPTEILEKRTKVTNTNNASWKNLASDVHSKIQTYSKEVNQKNGVYPPHTTLQRHTKANKNVFIPRFFYPHGKPVSHHQQNAIFKNIEDVFRSLPNMQATKEQFSSVTKACNCPLYWKAPLFIACGGEKLGFVEMNTFMEYWRDLTSVCHDDASRFMRIVTRSTTRPYIIPEDLIPLVQDVVNTHPGLTFLKQAPEFHSRYVHTVICRVYYCVNQSWNGQISLTELRKCDFLRAIQLLEEEEDINQVTAYFSYEHFYVIYCKFWELDRDHDLFISKEDLARHSDHALSTRIIDRIFSRTRSKARNSMLQEGKMSYTDFVIFLLAEEDKRHPRAIEYWFRCMDLDGDGFLSMYELEYFYDEQLQRMEAMGIECLPFEDCLCQMLDMIQPKVPGKISLSDLKRCKMTPIFFDTFFNLEKYLDHEQRDPFASQRDHENDMSDWDRYAAEEYELLVAEEGGNDHSDDIHYAGESLGGGEGDGM
ncbi:uncharacterized protein LOC135849037 isoform X2 [Planococcus citri]|uniref:uncharacterized protein LOC135849037 isoform X2 n=1 Tax=Planococcus citri TaxID=170843 RepID=UPI0031F996B9